MKLLGGEAGFEPATFGFGGGCDALKESYFKYLLTQIVREVCTILHPICIHMQGYAIKSLIFYLITPKLQKK